MAVNGNGNGDVQGGMMDPARSRAELLTLGEEQAQGMLGVRLADAFAMIDSGQLDGTVAEAELRMLRFLLAG